MNKDKSKRLETAQSKKAIDLYAGTGLEQGKPCWSRAQAAVWRLGKEGDGIHRMKMQHRYAREARRKNTKNQRAEESRAQFVQQLG